MLRRRHTRGSVSSSERCTVSNCVSPAGSASTIGSSPGGAKGSPRNLLWRLPLATDWANSSTPSEPSDSTQGVICSGRVPGGELWRLCHEALLAVRMPV